jgi:hypothetical protein
MNNSTTVNYNQEDLAERMQYFLTHILPWIMLFMLLASISICLFHYKNQTCMFEKKKKKSSGQEPLLV